jgi:hypothetical protein
VQWLGDQLLDGCDRGIDQQPHSISPICAVLSHSNPSDRQRSRILVQLLNCLRISEVAPIVLEHFPQMNTEDMAVVSSGDWINKYLYPLILGDTIRTLQALIKNEEFSSRAVRVAALLAMDHPEAEKVENFCFNFLRKKRSLSF